MPVAATVWRGRIAFGMVAIPVRLYKAARRERMRFRHVYAPDSEPEPEAPAEPEIEPPAARGTVREFPAPRTAAPVPGEPEPPAFDEVAPVHERPVGEDAAPLPRSSILKGFETAKDEYAVFHPREIAALRPRTSSELEITEFVRLADIDPIYFDTSYHVLPENGGERPFALLVAALERTGDAAAGTLAMHGREHAVVLRPAGRGLLLHTLFYANEVRADEGWQGDAGPVNAKELELATMLVKSMEAPFDPAKWKDRFEERLRELIAGRAPTPLRAAAPSAATRTPPVDILEALKKSLAAIRKPAQPERRPAKPARRKRG